MGLDLYCKNENIFAYVYHHNLTGLTFRYFVMVMAANYTVYLDNI